MATNTGTAALHLVLLYCDVNQSTTVSIPPVCFTAVKNAVLMTNASICFDSLADITIDVMNYGFPCEPIGNILDAAEALGGDIPTQYPFVILSFNWNKPITCGSGGMILTNSPKAKESFQYWRNQGRGQSWQEKTYFLSFGRGFNYRMNGLQATMGMESLAAWPENYAKKVAIYKRYLKASLPIIKPPNGFHWNHWITLLRTSKCDKVLQAFRKNKIETRAMFAPHTREFPEINKFADETMCLPSSPGLTEEEQAKVIQVAKGALA